jgi:tRNA U34 5-methylaminomethyl-2-thiouridine-forming methyltransferase MnmC
MERKIIISEDGSHSLYVPELNEHYHSIRGAIQESRHIFIASGLLVCKKRKISILEIGFGTGLNAILSLQFALEKKVKIEYTAIEKYPLIKNEWSRLNYGKLVSDGEDFLKIHESPWGSLNRINDYFSLNKIQEDLRTVKYNGLYDLVYFDAFAPDIQPSLWTEEIFLKIFNVMKSSGLLLTYSVKGSVRRSMEACGFITERLPGPPGKRQILRAFK